MPVKIDIPLSFESVQERGNLFSVHDQVAGCRGVGFHQNENQVFYLGSRRPAAHPAAAVFAEGADFLLPFLGECRGFEQFTFRLEVAEKSNLESSAVGVEFLECFRVETRGCCRYG